MKKSLHLSVFIVLIFGLLLISCGPSKKLVSSEARADQLQKDNALTMKQLQECKNQVKVITDEKLSMEGEYAVVRNDLKVLTSESKMTIAEQASRLKILQNLIQSQRDVMFNLKNSIADALINYNTDELSVFTKNGNVYVSLAEKLLFKSGSDVVDPKGKEALKTLAEVLNTTKDITVMIEGHTDNVPIKTSKHKDNWDLSTARATAILRILSNDNGFDSNRITASGQGEFHPLQSNDTPEGRAANRRTEIILTPNLSELFRLLDQ